MADNYTITEGVGKTMAADDISSVWYPRVKIAWGVDGAQVDASASNPFPITNTNVEFAEDAAHVSGDKGVMALAVRKDTQASTCGTDGDYGALVLNATGALYTDVTKVVPGTGATNLGKAEDAAHTSGDVGVMALAVRNDTAGTLAGTDGDYAPPQLDSAGNLRVAVIGTGATNIGKAEDAAHTTGDVGVMAMGVVKPTQVGTSSTTDDYAALTLDSVGRLKTSEIPKAADGVSTARNLGATATGQVLVAAPATLFSISYTNGDSGGIFLKVYDKATAPTSGDTPVMVLYLATLADTARTFPKGIAFANGISVRAVTTIADNGNTGATASTIHASVSYV